MAIRTGNMGEHIMQISGITNKRIIHQLEAYTGNYAIMCASEIPSEQAAARLRAALRLRDAAREAAILHASGDIDAAELDETKRQVADRLEVLHALKLSSDADCTDIQQQARDAIDGLKRPSPILVHIAQYGWTAANDDPDDDIRTRAELELLAASPSRIQAKAKNTHQNSNFELNLN